MADLTDEELAPAHRFECPHCGVGPGDECDGGCDREPMVHVSRAAAGRAALEARQQELLATIVRVTNETPYPDEIKGWTGQRAKMVAEIGTLKARIVELESAHAGDKERVRGVVLAGIKEYASYHEGDPHGGHAAVAVDINFLNRVCSRTKHGRNEIGQPGDCEVECLKCEAERRLEAIRGW